MFILPMNFIRCFRRLEQYLLTCLTKFFKISITLDL
uniref:Uncharacterized protein n=1 Tax=Arundo donax TaxID=35708 RepID=A0A0A9HCY2_ARUDO